MTGPAEPEKPISPVGEEPSVDEAPPPESNVLERSEPVSSEPEEGAPDGDRRRRLPSLRSLFHRPRTRRGFFALLLVVAGLAATAAFGTMTAVSWTDTADFCGRCHQMGPELAAYDAGPHRDVACAECHVEPGIGGWVKAKLNGTKQLIQVLTGTFPTPIPPPDHASLPAATETCLSCHSLERLATTTVLTRTQYSADEANTKQFVALMVRPSGGDPLNTQRSVHWHVLQEVDYGSADPAAQTIDWVQIIRDDGTVERFIASNQVTVPEDVDPDLQQLQQTEAARRMDCLDCHNRVGHPLPNPRREVDQAMNEGVIDPSLPQIKAQAMTILTAGYPTLDAADAAAASLRDFYRLRYPAVADTQKVAIDDAVTEVQLIYRLAATPEMKVTALTYPDNLGHTDFPGCFRCHDGAHFKVVDGKVTNDAIPFKCDTCHTFPQIGEVTSLPMGEAPVTHEDGLWVFNHGSVAPAEDPGGTSCGVCHAKDYCVNCHETGAVLVNHDDMLLNHASVTHQTGAAACAYCHQPAYCARCHSEPVLPGGNAPATSGETGMQWPLVQIDGGGP